MLGGHGGSEEGLGQELKSGLLFGVVCGLFVALAFGVVLRLVFGLVSGLVGEPSLGEEYGTSIFIANNSDRQTRECGVILDDSDGEKKREGNQWS